MNDEKSSQTEHTENRPPRAQDIIDAIKAIWRRGNASRLDTEFSAQPTWLHNFIRELKTVRFSIITRLRNGPFFNSLIDISGCVQ